MSFTPWPWKRKSAQADLSKPDRSGIKDALKFGLSWTHLDRLEDAVLSAIPLATYALSHWEETPDGVYLHMRAPAEGVHLYLGFRRDAEFLDAGYFVLDETLQRHGHATSLAQQLTLAADDLKISMIRTVANLDGGSYAWAAMAARPKDVEATRMKLLPRMNELVRAGHWRPEDKEAARAILMDSQDSYFMFTLSRLKADNGRHLGGDLLGSKVIGDWYWEAFWDLNDDEHRNYIIKAIG